MSNAERAYRHTPSSRRATARMEAMSRSTAWRPRCAAIKASPSSPRRGSCLSPTRGSRLDQRARSRILGPRLALKTAILPPSPAPRPSSVRCSTRPSLSRRRRSSASPGSLSRPAVRGRGSPKTSFTRRAEAGSRAALAVRSRGRAGRSTRPARSPRRTPHRGSSGNGGLPVERMERARSGVRRERLNRGFRSFCFIDFWFNPALTGGSHWEPPRSWWSPPRTR